MSVLNFPTSPSTGDLYAFGDYTYRYDGEKWTTISTGNVAALRRDVDYIMMSYPLDATSYLPDGYVTDGSVSYTAELQQALDDAAAGSRAVLLPNFPVLIDPTGTTYGGLQVPSNSKVVWLTNSSLKLKPNNLGNYEVISIRDKQNVELFNPVIYGDKYTHTGTTGEWGMGIAIRGDCANIVIHNPRIYECWGDGIYIGQVANAVSSTPKNIYIIRPELCRNRRQGISVTSVDGLFISDANIWDTRSDDSPAPLPDGPHAGIDIEPNGSFSMLRNIRIAGLHGGGNNSGLFYVFLGAITNPSSDPYHVDITVDGISDDGSASAVMAPGLNKDAHYSGSIKISNVSSNNALLNGVRVRNWPVQCGLPVTIDGISISNWLSNPAEAARSRAPITTYSVEPGYPAIGNLFIRGITLRQTRPAAGVSERAFHGENGAGGVSNVTLEFDHVNSTRELRCLAEGPVRVSVSGSFGTCLVRTITSSATLIEAETCDYIVSPASAAKPTLTMGTFTERFVGKKIRLKQSGGAPNSTGFRLRTAIDVPMSVNGVSGGNFFFSKASGVIELTYEDGAFVVRCDGDYYRES